MEVDLSLRSHGGSHGITLPHATQTFYQHEDTSDDEISRYNAAVESLRLHKDRSSSSGLWHSPKLRTPASAQSSSSGKRRKSSRSASTSPRPTKHRRYSQDPVVHRPLSTRRSASPVNSRLSQEDAPPTHRTAAPVSSASSHGTSYNAPSATFCFSKNSAFKRIGQVPALRVSTGSHSPPDTGFDSPLYIGRAAASSTFARPAFLPPPPLPMPIGDPYKSQLSYAHELASLGRYGLPFSHSLPHDISSKVDPMAAFRDPRFASPGAWLGHARSLMDDPRYRLSAATAAAAAATLPHPGLMFPGYPLPPYPASFLPSLPFQSGHFSPRDLRNSERRHSDSVREVSRPQPADSTTQSPPAAMGRSPDPRRHSGDPPSLHPRDSISDRQSDHKRRVPRTLIPHYQHTEDDEEEEDEDEELIVDNEDEEEDSIESSSDENKSTTQQSPSSESRPYPLSPSEHLPGGLIGSLGGPGGYPYHTHYMQAAVAAGGVPTHPVFGVMGGRRPRDPSKPPSLKKYKCDLCSKAFSRSNTLVTHRRIHTGEKPFECEICSRAFRQPGNLTRHRLTHTTVKPYVCPVCKKAFNRASNLHTHMRTHANFKPFLCPYCGKGFQQKMDLKIHCYTHTGHPATMHPHAHHISQLDGVAI